MAKKLKLFEGWKVIATVPPDEKTRRFMVFFFLAFFASVMLVMVLIALESRPPDPATSHARPQDSDHVWGFIGGGLLFLLVAAVMAGGVYGIVRICIGYSKILDHAASRRDGQNDNSGTALRSSQPPLASEKERRS